jgi:GDP-fucose transporter C1
VLNKTTIPVFFLFVQLSIAVVLLALSHLSGLIRITLALDPTTVKALAPLIAINVLGLKYVPAYGPLSESEERYLALVLTI